MKAATRSFRTMARAPVQTVGWRPPLLASVMALLTACAAVGPDYRAPPAVDTGLGWTPPVTQNGGEADLAHWWSQLGDPVLEHLIEEALAQNLDLQEASARVAEARALRDRMVGERLPTVGAEASVNRRGQSENGPLPVGSIPGLEANQTIYDAGFDAAWELDLFGARRRAGEAADARLRASEIEAIGVRMHLIAEVARTWFTAVGAGYEVRMQEATLHALQQNFELVQRRQQAGADSMAEVEAARAQWAGADAALPELEARQRAAVLALGVLLGKPPEQELDLLDVEPQLRDLIAFPLGERVDILRRRPDVLAAERQLAASTADIGVATAELFPKLSIGAGGGFQALNRGDWFDASSTRFSVLPMISWRLFDGGRVRAEIRASQARQQQAALAYERAVLAALGDAERSLSDYDAALDALDRRWVAVAAAYASHDYARARYEAGDIALIDLLMAERVLYETETAAARAHTRAALCLVALYKALGGGWEAPAVAATAQGPTPRTRVGAARTASSP